MKLGDKGLDVIEAQQWLIDIGYLDEVEYYYILSGNAIYNDNGKEYYLQTGDLTYTPDGESHGIKNLSDTEKLQFIALVVKE